MSLESALDEERREVIALLEGRPNAPRPSSRNRDTGRTSSPMAAQSPVRSMLDVAGDLPTRSASIAGPTGGVTHAANGSVRSMLEPSPYASSQARARQLSPTTDRHVSGPGRLDPESAYQFEMLPSIDAHALPKRVSQGGRKARALDTMGQSQTVHQNKARHNSAIPVSLLGGRKSQSPSSRLPGRADSPGGRMLNNNSMNLMADPTTWVTESGKKLDLSNAYRRLSDAALLRSGGSLSNLPTRKGSDPIRGEQTTPGGGVRLQKDYFDGSVGGAIDSSDDDYSDDSSGDDRRSERSRGRKRTRMRKNSLDQEQSESPGEDDGRRPKSLLSAAEEERKRLASTYKVRSLLEPQVTITGPDGEKATLSKKAGVHPSTSFDQGGSGVSSPMNSDTEAEITDIKRAQKLALNVSPIHSSPEAHRVIRQVVRGDYATLQREAEQGLRRQRVYLVATDISPEAAYALEWTIGTVLRDGDTLIAVYAVDEDAGTGAEKGDGGVGIGEAASIMRDTASVVGSLEMEERAPGTGTHTPSPLASSTAALDASLENAPDLAGMQKAERERYHAAMEVSERCIKLLRKTRLQVRVIVEVFHCKSPKHMLTEVIDFLDPTLVILGSRGRSALKGVLLGSFSNYLVTKSSVPVMVARKRLRKHSKYKRTNVRLSNVLTSPSQRLASAKID